MTLRLRGSTSGYAEINAPAVAGDNSLTLPTTAGTIRVAGGAGVVDGDYTVATGATISGGTSVIRFDTGATIPVQVDSNGHVGIGTNNNTSAALDVHGDIRISRGSRGDGTGKIFFGSDSGDYLQLQDIGTGGNIFELVQDGSKKVVVRGTNGNVGIGTDDPTSKLEVATSVDGEATLATFKNTSKGGTNETVDVAFGLEGNSTTSNVVLRAGKEANHSSGAATDNFFAIHTTLDNTSSEKLRIDSAGRILAGTTSFTGEASLVLQASNAGATTQAQLWLNRGEEDPATDNVLGQIIFGDATAAGSNGAMIQARADSSWGGANGNPTRIAFFTESFGSDDGPSERLRISSDGRITHGPVITRNWTDSGAANGVTETLNLMAFNTNNNNRIYGEITVWCCRSGLAQQRGYIKYAIGMSYYGGSYAGFINELERSGVAGFSTLVIERDGDNIRLRHVGNTAATSASMTIQFVGSIGGNISFLN